VIRHLNSHRVWADAFHFAFQTPFAFGKEAAGGEHHHEQHDRKSAFATISVQVLHGKSPFFPELDANEFVFNFIPETGSACGSRITMVLANGVVWHNAFSIP
jgi:hypothetical protein